MQKRRAKPSKKEERDPVLEEFETKDLGDDIRRSNSWVTIRRDPSVRSLPTSLLLSPRLVEKLREKGAKRGIGYQTMLKIIVHEHVDEY